jgi:hypothetical protein
MKILIAAGLAAMALAATSVATAAPVYAVHYDRSTADVVATPTPAIYQPGLASPGVYKADYYAHGRRGAHHHRRHHRHGRHHRRV